MLFNKPSALINKNKPVNHKYTDKVLRNELGSSIFFVEPAELVEHLFPDSFLPWNIDDVFRRLSNASISDNQVQYSLMNGNSSYPMGRWIWAPKLDTWSAQTGKREKEFAVFIDGIIQSTISLGPKRGDGIPLRDLTAEFNSLPLISEADGMLRKPDILGIERSILSDLWQDSRAGWEIAAFIIELKCGSNYRWGDIEKDLLNKVYLIFQAQIDRRFVIAISLMQFDVVVSVFERSGVVHTNFFNINDQPQTFLRVIIGLVFADSVRIGFDPTMEKVIAVRQSSPRQEVVWSVQIRHEWATVSQILFWNPMLRGRATMILIIMFKGKQFCLKDLWIYKKRYPDEVDLYEMAKKANVRNILSIHDSWDVFIGNKADDTNYIRGEYDDMDCKVHRRILFNECGVTLQFFTSKRELIQALYDAVLGMSGCQLRRF